MADALKRTGRHDAGIAPIAEHTMKPTDLLRSHQWVPVCLAMLGALGSALLLADPARAATGAQQRRLQITVDLQRTGAVQAGADRGRERLTQQWTFSAVLQSDGTPQINNPLDPEDGRRRLELAQRQQARIENRLAEVRARSGQRPAAAMPDMQAMQARAMALQARCGADRECLMREAAALSAASLPGGNAGVQARLQGFGQAAAACEREPAGAARTACQAAARLQAGAGPDDSDADDVVETPYLHFIGTDGCQLDVGVKIDGRVEGSFSDVQGEVPYSETTRVDQRQRDGTRCALLQAVLDTRSGRLWTYVSVLMGEAQGTRVREERGRQPQRHEGGVSVAWREGQEWLGQRLVNLNAGGSDQLRVPVPGGQTELRMRWSFRPL
ncbi:MAG: hypothetical protein KF788_23005 [Piscinibacter sp.]|nr:hypothetical protein [Piscinibacter sp.]